MGVSPQPQGLVAEKNYEGMRYIRPEKAAQPVINRLRNEEHCDLVVCLTHLGWINEPNTDPDFVSNTTGIDVLLGGHSHTYFTEPHFLYDSNGHEVFVDHQGKNAQFVGTIEVKIGDPIK